jgi:FkbM family methyltransferase
MRYKHKQQSGRREHSNRHKPQELSRLSFQKALQRYNAGLYQEAGRLLDSHLKSFPKDDAALNLAGLIDYQTGRYDSSLQWFRSAIQLKDQEHSYHNNLGAALQDKGDLKGAIPCFLKALDLNPDYSQASFNLGGAYKVLGELSLAMEWYEYTLARNPDFTLAYNNKACIYKDQGRIDEAIELFREAAQRDPVNAAATGSNCLLCLNYLEEADPETVFRQHKEWAARHAPETGHINCDCPNDAIPTRRIRVGYVSADFRNHSVAFFIHPIIEGHDRKQVEVFCYADVAKPDAVTQVMMTNADHWQNIHGMSDEQVFQCIQKAHIDILVDLAGHSGRNRMKLFARKPAPIQVSYLGYPNTTGLTAMDYRFTDAVADPPGLTDAYYTENLIRLPEGFLCYNPLVGTPDVANPPCLENGYITFGSFNNRAKINSKTIALWAGLLTRIPDSRLILKSSLASDRDARQQLLSLFVQNGIEASRIEILSHLSAFDEHLKQYQRVDIALDTFPYNGTTTTCEALWMGVPVITLSGNTHASRVGASILSRLGLNGWIISSADDYSNISATLANDIENLKYLRRTLREKFQNSSLMNENKFMAKLETAYRRMWQHWCAKLIAEGVDRSSVMDVRIKGEITVCVPNDLSCLTSYILQERQDWFEQEISFVRTFLKPGMNVVDIGANYGTYSLTAAKAVGPAGKVWAFEPSQLTAAYLTRSIRRNGLDHVSLIPAGISDTDRQGFLSMNTNSELNEVVESEVAGHSESIALMSLDGWMKTVGARIDLIKMDAEGQEENVIRGGKHFFASCSPLILYEIKHGNAFHLELAQSFMNIGYRSYRLIPELNILAPFSMGEKPDAYQLNLFCCKDDCAERLRRQELLVSPKMDDSLPADIPSPLWIDYLQGFPYVTRLLHLWQAYCQEQAGASGWRIHQQALGAYAVTRLPGYSASDRYEALTKGYGLMSDLVQSQPTVSRILTATRMALDLGYREDAINMLNLLYGIFKSDQEFSVNEPFLSVSGRLAELDPGNDFGQWLIYGVLETREICQAFSSYFTGRKSLPDLELMRTSPFYSDEMARRRQLICLRFGVA